MAVAAALIGVAGHEFPFYEYDPRAGQGARQRERYEVTVITKGRPEDPGSQTGRTIVKLLEPGAEGVRIPRGLDIPMFWRVLEECCTRADEINARAGVT